MRARWRLSIAVQIGPYKLAGRVLLAPMAGVTDLPFRRLCRRMGATLAAGEMLAADGRLWDTELSRRRRDHTDEPEPRVVQIAGGDPDSTEIRPRSETGAQSSTPPQRTAPPTVDPTFPSSPKLTTICPKRFRQ